jgi:hypothetical protein
VGIILPNDKYKSYINLCLGLVLILMILKPLSDFLNTGVTAEDLLPKAWAAEDFSNSGVEIQQELLRRSLNQQAEAQMTGICAEEGFTLVSAEAQADEDYTSLRAIYLEVKKTEAGSRPFLYIEPPASEEAPEIKRLKNTLSEVYNMSPDNIHITEID